MSKRVAIVGAGGHAKVVADIVQKSGDQVLGFFDDFTDRKSLAGLPILGPVSEYIHFPEAYFLIAIGNADAREHFAAALHGVRWYTAIHPAAVVSEVGASVGEGTVIMANAVVNSFAAVGKHCIINTGAIVEHDNTIGDYVHISCGAKLGGTVKIGAKTWIGIGSTLKEGIEVCADCMIGAGAVVVRDIAEPGTYVGVPVQRIK